jgi:hypothetical protein
LCDREWRRVELMDGEDEESVWEVKEGHPFGYNVLREPIQVQICY